ncbi:fibronectin type III domain-containing protein, partial [Candidatus Saccharibacteria bacterium]|nr:fibronectin type III domain-containing protein [Candidatus Saccharibacteria bacterium]
TPPSAPSNVSASGISTSQISLSWSPSSDNVGISYYQIYRNGNSVGTTGSTSYTDGGLNAGTTYTYSIYAIDTSGNRNVYNGATQVATGTTYPAADTTPPSAPSNVSATGVSTSQINLSWSPSTDNVGVAYYRVFRNGNTVGTTNGTRYADGGLNAGQTYTYSIYAVDTSGNLNVYNAATQVATGTTLSTPPPPPPPPPPPSGTNVTICMFDDGSFLYPAPSSCRNVGGLFTTGCLYPDGSVRPGGC